MVLAHVGVNRVPPGFARPRDGAGGPLLGRAAAGSLRTRLTIDVGEPVAASVGRSAVQRRRRSSGLGSIIGKPPGKDRS
jgi:hypothetical protein